MSAEKKTRVAIITSNYWPERTGIGQVTTEFAEYLAAAGLDVRVSTAMPYYPEWSIYPEYRNSLWRSEERNGVSIARATHYSVPNPTTLRRILHEITLCAFAAPNMLRVLWGADVAFVVSPDLSHAFVGSVLARTIRVPLILIVQDVMPDAAIEMGMLKNRTAIAVSRWLARVNYALAQKIYTLSEGMKARIGAITDDLEKIEIVPNTIDAEELAPRTGQRNAFRDQFVPEGAFAVVHAGNMGEKQDLNLLLRTARRLLDRKDIHFYVFGDGAGRAQFLKTKEEWRLENVSLFPLQDRSLLPDMLYGADVCLVSQLPSAADVVVPSKLITSMGAGAMIVAACSADSETARLVGQSIGGLVTQASDDAALAEVILAMTRNEIDSRAYRENARAFAQGAYGRKAVYGAVADFVERQFGEELHMPGSPAAKAPTTVVSPRPRKSSPVA